MFTSFDENVFRQAIKDKDYLCLKVNTVSSMLDDPTFERGETMKVLQILSEQVPEIFEDYVELDYEERLEPCDWDKRYFTKLTYWFQENFSKERVEYIRKVGNVVHRDTAKHYAESNAAHDNVEQRIAEPRVEQPTKSTKPKNNPTRENKTARVTNVSIKDDTQKNKTTIQEKKKENFMTPRVILSVGTLVIVGVLLIKFLAK